MRITMTKLKRHLNRSLSESRRRRGRNYFVFGIGFPTYLRWTAESGGQTGSARDQTRAAKQQHPGHYIKIIKKNNRNIITRTRIIL